MRKTYQGYVHGQKYSSKTLGVVLLGSGNIHKRRNREDEAFVKVWLVV